MKHQEIVDKWEEKRQSIEADIGTTMMHVRQTRIDALGEQIAIIDEFLGDMETSDKQK